VEAYALVAVPRSEGFPVAIVATLSCAATPPVLACLWWAPYGDSTFDGPGHQGFGSNTTVCWLSYTSWNFTSVRSVGWFGPSHTHTGGP
jgi:hypothetical protein